MAQADYYAALGVGREAGPEELKQAYRRLAIQWHPDRNPGSRLAEERFKGIAEAYAVLSHPAKRRQYDLLGPAGFKSEYSREDIFQGFEPGDFFKLFGLTEARDTLARIFDESRPPASPPIPEEAAPRLSDFFAGFGQKTSPRDTRSPDLLIPLVVSFQEAALGGTKFVAYNTAAGAVKVPVAVPAGALTGQRLTVKGRGPARAGGQPGDLIVTLTVTPHPDFIRRGFDLLTALVLSAADLAAGCKPLVDTLGGPSLRLKVPPGTRPGATFKIPGYGLPRPEGGRGDLLVQIKTEFPQK